MGAYSWADVLFTISGPSGNISGGGADMAGLAKDGITVSMTEDKGSLTTGVDGGWMQNLHVASPGTITLRCLKTSRLNAQLSAMYDGDTGSSANYGQNTITIRDVVRGDDVEAQGAGFRKLPDNAYGEDGGIMEWAFNCGYIKQKLGTGTSTIQGIAR